MITHRTPIIKSVQNSILILTLLFTVSISLFLPAGLHAQNSALAISGKEKEEVINSINKMLFENYIYPEKVKKIAAYLTANLNKGAYNDITNPADFSTRLTNDLFTISSDRHFNVIFDPDWVKESKKAISKKDSIDLLERDFPNAHKENFGFKEVKILDGNIGYICLTKFWNPSIGGETAVAAMNFVSNTDAVIIDLRNNGGGYGQMVQLLSSYFFDSDPLLLVEIYYRKENKTTQDYTLPYIPGKRRPDVDLYILTNSGTFSAAESFTCIFKNRKRAVIIGQTTGGGAHPVEHLAVSERFSIFMPNAKPIDPITKTDWEVTGIKPDIKAADKEVLATAHIMALEKLMSVNKADSIMYQWQLSGIKAKQYPVRIDSVTLKSYTGIFKDKRLTFEDGKLFYQKTGSEKYELIPISRDLFMIEEASYLHIKINIENGEVTGITRLYEDGASRKELKNK